MFVSIITEIFILYHVSSDEFRNKRYILALVIFVSLIISKLYLNIINESFLSFKNLVELQIILFLILDISTFLGNNNDGESLVKNNE